MLRVLAKLLNPRLVFRELIQRLPWIPLRTKVDWDAAQRPHYLFGVYWAARQAQLLQIPRISAVEFGVAAGNGLVELESIGEVVSRETGIAIDIYGFDMGSIGMPPPQDFRDCPYIWMEGFFKMDSEALSRRLKQSELLLGNVKQTVWLVPKKMSLMILTKTSLAAISRRHERWIAFDVCSSTAGCTSRAGRHGSCGCRCGIRRESKNGVPLGDASCQRRRRGA